MAIIVRVGVPARYSLVAKFWRAVWLHSTSHFDLWL